jgi:hypothetical protein
MEDNILGALVMVARAIPPLEGIVKSELEHRESEE